MHDAYLNAVYTKPSMRRRYEAWFVRCGLADGSGAWWFRYLLLHVGRNPLAMPERKAQVWATWFPSGGSPQTYIAEFPIELWQTSAHRSVPFHVRVGRCGIDEQRCWGHFEKDGHVISWDLGIHSTFGVTLSDKGWIGFSRSPHSDAAFSGTIELDGRRFSGHPLGFGVQGHNCGYRHRTWWRWMHAYFPQSEGGATLEALCYDMPLGLIFRKAVLHRNGVATVFKSIQDDEIIRTPVRLRWKFRAQNGGAPVEAVIEGIAPGVHELPYTRTDGSGTFPVSNASMASATLSFKDGSTLETQTGAVLEFGGEGHG